MKFSTNLALDASLASLLSSNIQPITIDEQSRVVYRSIQRNRQAICPYISSTFSDLEEEFKHLHLDTFVKLKQISKSHGCHFDPVDYRRTAIDFRSTSDYILKNALDVIDQTIPFFICIIGNTYGPHISENAPCLKLPNNDNIKTQAFSTTERNLLFAASHGHPWVLDVEVQKCSLMELEILAACFLENSAISRHCFFYIKDFYPHLLKTGGNSFNQDTVLQPDYIQEIGTVFEAESDYAQGRLNNLKQLIINKGLPIKYFTSKEVLGNAILNDWTEVITRLYPSLPKYVLQGDEILTSTWSQQSLMGFLQNGYVSYPSEEKIRNDLFNFSQAVSKYIPNAKNQVADDTEKMAVESEDIIGFKTGDGIFTTANSFIETIRHCESKERAASKQVFVLVGDPGIGKSALLANWMHDFKGVFPEVLVISEFVGSSYLSYDASAFCRKCIHKLREKSWNKRVYGMDGISDSTSFSGLVETFSACLELVPCLLVIDGLNDVCYGMGEDIGKIKGLEWLPEALPSNCLMVVSTRRSDLTYKALKKRRDTHFQFMPSIDVKTRERIFKRLYRPDGRDLVDKVWTNRLSERPLFLMTLSDLLRSCRSQRDVTQVVEKCTALRTFRDFWKSVFVLWSRRHSWSKHQSSGQPGSVRNRSNASGWVADALKFIASSRGGLTLHELIHLLFLMGYRGRSTVTPHDWNLFRCTAGSALRLADDGLIVIAHEDIKLAVEYFLLGKGKYSATATTTGSNQNVELHFHHLLGSYFLKYGSMQRKMVELPWQLMQGNDFTSLFQILCKSRFFLEMCVESLNRASLHADHKLYWQKLAQHDFSIVQCFQLMISQATEEQSSFLESKESRRASVATGAHDSRFKQLVGMILKAPSMIIVTQHEEGSAPSLHRSTDDSRSETEERDFSETESFSFFITEPEADHHHLSVGGWSPIQDDPEQTIATGLLDADDQSRLRLNIAYFLFQLGNDYHEEACRQVEELRENLENSRPLSSVQQLTLVELAHLEGLNLPEHKPDILKQALDTYRQLTLQTMDLGYNRLRNLMQIKGELLLQLSRSMIDDGEYAHSHPLIEKAFEAMHKCGSVCGQALGETVFAMFLHLQGMSSEAEEITLRGLDTFIRWHGGMHLSVAVALCDLAHIYKTSQQNDEVLNRKAMLALKQALHIYDFNEKKLEAAEVANQIGGLLTEENTLRSKVEADECFGRALDTFVTTPSKNNGVKVRKIHMGRKKTGGDLKLGRFIHGSAKPLDTRRPERPFSSLSWHTSELSKLSICNQSVVPLPSPSRSEKLADRPSSIRPYSPFSTKSVGNCVLVTPRNQHMRRVQSASVYSYGRRSEMSPSQSSKRVLSGKHPASEKTQELPRYLSDGVDREQIEVVEGREVPVVIVPGGRNSRLSIKLDLEDWERTSRHLGDDPDDHLYLTEMSGRSEASSAFKRRLPTAKTDYQRSPIHRSHCLYRSGPDNLCLTVHGPHSLISDVLHPSPSPRPVVKATGVSHESAWYHVPGRYATPEAILPPKRNQKRPSTAGSSRHSVATTYHDTARSDSYHSVLRTSSAAMRRHLASQQSSRGIAESTIHEEYLAANFNDDERQLHHS